MQYDLVTLSKQFPGLMVSVSLEDLLSAGRTLSAEIIENIAQTRDGATFDSGEKEQLLTREHLLSKTLYGVGIMNHLIRKECPDFVKGKPEQPKPPAPPKLPQFPKMSFYRRPVRNTRPCREASPEDILKYLLSDYAKENTERLRAIKDNRERSRFKVENFDYITPGGIFKSRKESDLVKASGYMIIDFDHIDDPAALVLKLAREDNFETILAFRSPSGDGVKWLVSLPVGTTKPDGTPFTHGEFFTILSNYVRRTYGYEADPSGKDICRACFLPHDPDAFLNPLYIEDNYDYDSTRFLHGTAE